MLTIIDNHILSQIVCFLVYCKACQITFESCYKRKISIIINIHFTIIDHEHVDSRNNKSGKLSIYPTSLISCPIFNDCYFRN